MCPIYNGANFIQGLCGEQAGLHIQQLLKFASFLFLLCLGPWKEWKPSLLPFVLCSEYTKSVTTWQEKLRMFLCKVKLRSCEYTCVCMCVHLCIYASNVFPNLFKFLLCSTALHRIIFALLLLVESSFTTTVNGTVTANPIVPHSGKYVSVINYRNQ